MTRPRPLHPARNFPLLKPLCAALACLFFFAAALRADEPFARSRDYDLRHSTIRMSFDTAQRKIFGDVTHSLSMLRDGTPRVAFDSVGLRIESVTLDGKPAQFDSTAGQLIVSLTAPAKRGDAHSIEIRYEGSPQQGIFFILPDKDYPNKPIEIWTQGEAEDTRYYLPTYDYPNDRLTTDTYLTVPATWETVSNGRLDSKTPAANGQVVWHWIQDGPLSTYLITIVAGELDRVDDTWRGLPLTYYAPRGDGSRIPITFSHTHDMLDFFATTLGVPYPWAKYAQVTVNEFTEEGMENTSATTLTTHALQYPALVAEYPIGEEDLISHELFHQWFGDLVTCKDWTNLWLNEGFATLAEYMWEEHEYGRDESDYTRWIAQRNWMMDERLFSVPILTSNFTDSMEYEGNIYAKAGLVLYTLREQLGAPEFYAALKHYLEKYRNQNVVTADLVRSIEESTNHNVDRFFQQWIYGAGAPSLAVHYSYDELKREVKLEVKQTQKVEGLVGLFTLHTHVEIVTASGTKRFPVTISRASDSFTFPADGAPLLVLLDPGDVQLAAVTFDKTPREWAYQLRHASTVPDRADAAVVLGGFTGQELAIDALEESAKRDPFWGVRLQALTSLARLGGTRSRDALFDALGDADPRAASFAATLLSGFISDPQVQTRLETVARSGKLYRQREAAIGALASPHNPRAYDVLVEAARTDSPDDGIRRAAFHGFAAIADQRATRIALDWSAPGKPLRTRSAAIRALGSLDRHNKDITRELLSFLEERYSDVRRAALSALYDRNDASAIAPLEAALQSGALDGPVEEFARRVVTHLREKQSEGAATP